jgi:1-deoxy-D-xylulose-5-phosphate synthase
MPLLNDRFDLSTLKSLSLAELEKLAGEIRAQIMAVCRQSGGHLASNLGVVELTIALHRVFNSPADALVFDVGHQCYTHKILTGRADQFSTLRQRGGISGFPAPRESVHDAHFAGHGGDAISVAMGLSLADPAHTKIALVGDGALGNGMSFEALNHLATTKQDVLVVINDNDYAIDRRVGALNSTNISDFIVSLGLPYVGVVDGHSLPLLIDNLRQLKSFRGPRVLHVKTIKGQGDSACAATPECYHFAGGKSCPSGECCLGRWVSEQLLDWGQSEPRLHVITPAMTQGANLSEWARSFPERFHDVGMAESHSVGLAAGLASGGQRVVCHLYATFLARAVDQIINNVALPALPIVFLVDRSGLVGADGCTHQGTWALSLLQAVPNLRLILPGDVSELVAAIKMSQTTTQPVCIFYPKVTAPIATRVKPVSLEPTWSGEVSATELVVTMGWTKSWGQKWAQQHHCQHLHCPVVKPFPDEILPRVAEFRRVTIFEENAYLGSFAELLQAKLQGKTAQTRAVAVPDRFIEHASRQEQLTSVGLGGIT